ncbi:MAG: hypothetical protein AB7S38_09450 [Vulcanimicrobiota bacterium]
MAGESKTPRGWWLFSPAVDLGVFLGSAGLALLALAVGYELGLLDRDTPEWTWVYAVLLVDVAHVYSTGFKVYFDPAEVRRRPGLYLLTPLAGFAIGLGLYRLGSEVFWRVLAYLAVWHFVRQQYGWVALYRRRLNEPNDWTRWVDTVAIYATTLYPLIWWHANMPRKFWWFLNDDFTSLPQAVAQLATPLYWLIMLAYIARSAASWKKGTPNPGRDIVMVTTAVCWYVGIITFNSDYAFTVTNVLIHGIPYMALVYWHTRRRSHEARQKGERGPLIQGIVPFLLTVWALAFCEEMFWNRAVWPDHDWLFGAPWHLPGVDRWLVPLLAVPQLTHYVLDGFIWKRRKNPELKFGEESATLTAKPSA